MDGPTNEERENRHSSARCAIGLFSKEVLSSSERMKHDLSYPERSISAWIEGSPQIQGLMSTKQDDKQPAGK